MSDEEVTDPKMLMDVKCGNTIACQKLHLVYEQCQSRVEAKGAGHCTGQFMDYMGCVDHCTSAHLFTKLK